MMRTKLYLVVATGVIDGKLYAVGDFKIINFPNVCSNIPASSAFGVCISLLIRYARASNNYSDFLKRHLYLSTGTK
jgi:hypothetical protein